MNFDTKFAILDSLQSNTVNFGSFIIVLTILWVTKLWLRSSEKVKEPSFRLVSNGQRKISSVTIESVNIGKPYGSFCCMVNGTPNVDKLSSFTFSACSKLGHGPHIDRQLHFILSYAKFLWVTKAVYAFCNSRLNSKTQLKFDEHMSKDCRKCCKDFDIDCKEFLAMIVLFRCVPIMFTWGISRWQCCNSGNKWMRVFKNAYVQHSPLKCYFSKWCWSNSFAIQSLFCCQSQFDKI